MTKFLLDTNVLSEFSRSAAPPDVHVKKWIESIDPAALFTSVLSLGEIRRGIELLPDGKKRRELEAWVDVDLRGWFGPNLLPITRAIANRWGILDAQCQQRGTPLGNIDGLLAATALEHELVVATRNLRHFTSLVGTISPWEPDAISLMKPSI